MKQQKRIRDYGIRIVSLPCGERNVITDVDGVTVGLIWIGSAVYLSFIQKERLTILCDHGSEWLYAK